jgi:hypothetical protein
MSVLNPDVASVLNILFVMDAEVIHAETTVERTGMFESRKVTINGMSCSIRDLVSTISEQILNADVADYNPNLERLKSTLVVISACEVEKRDWIATIFHWFSSRDNDVLEVEHEADIKIHQHEAFMLVQEGYEIQDPPRMTKNFFQSIISNKPEETYKCSNENYTVHEAPFYLDRRFEGFEYSYRPSAAYEQFLIPALISHQKNSDGGDTYRMIFRGEVNIDGYSYGPEDILSLLTLL